MDYSEDELTMALCAIRYTMGRHSYIVSNGVAWARKYGAASPRVRDIIIRDIEEEIDRVNKGFTAALGSDLDAQAWREVLADLKMIQNRREIVVDRTF
ncbi:unnamed protein product [Sphagnum tenellum]